MSQERAKETQQVLIRAAAEQIDRNGYAGATLSQICRMAQVSMGALTFHFPTKEQLANAVVCMGISTTRTAVQDIVTLPAPALVRARTLLCCVGRLLESDTTVRAAARLTREQSSAVEWSEVWLRQLRMLLDEAGAARQLRPGMTPQLIISLARYLTTGLEADMRRHHCAPDEEQPLSLEEFMQVWDFVLSGAVPPGTASTGPGAGPPTGGAGGTGGTEGG